MRNTDIEIERLPTGLTWPGNRHIAVVFNLAYEMWTSGTTSGVGPMGNVLPDGLFDPNADSYGRYNATEGIPRLVSICERHDVGATLMTSGLVAESYPEQVRAFAAKGHDIVAHGLSQDMVFPTLSASEAEQSILRSTALIQSATGTRPVGWVSPRVTSSPEIHSQLARQGYRWHGDALDADLPYLQSFGEHRILAIPMSVELNDLPHTMRFGRTPAQFVELFRETLAGVKSQPAETVILDIFAHGHCFGRPAAAWAFDEILRICTLDETLWLTTRSEIASHSMQLKERAA